MGKIHILSEAVANKMAAGEVEAYCGRERSGSPQPKSRAQRGISPTRSASALAPDAGAEHG
jgi:hypothetical protein